MRIVSALENELSPAARFPARAVSRILMMPRFSPAAVLLLSAWAALLTSCRKPEIRVYLAPRDATPAPAEQTAGTPDTPAPAKQAERPKPAITYTLPAGWQEAPPGQVSIAAFVIKDDGAEANINVTPLPDLRGRESLVVNMYREQTGQPPIEQGDLAKTLQPIDVAGGEGQLLETVGANKEKKQIRLIAVIAHRDGRSWFYRISGDDAFVAAQKPTFLDFLKSVHISEPPAASEPTSVESTPPKPEP